MLWMCICEYVCVGAIGGIVGGCLMAITQKSTNLSFMDHWGEDIYRLQGGITLAHHKLEDLDNKLSTFFVDKPVHKHVNKYKNNGYRRQRHFNYRG